jgi:ATP-dependent DNA helicase RecQ
VDDGRERVMVASSAFGLGIDYQCVRAVLNYKLPFLLDYYVQQDNRAGRDGERALSLTLFSEVVSAAKLSQLRGGEDKQYIDY